MLCVGAVGPRIAAITLEHSLWLPYLLCATGLAASFPVLFWMPETLPDVPLSQLVLSASSTPMRNPETTWKGRIESTLHVYQAVLKDQRILAGLVCVFLAQFRSVAIDILLPYVSFKFDWPLSKV